MPWPHFYFILTVRDLIIDSIEVKQTSGDEQGDDELLMNRH